MTRATASSPFRRPRAQNPREYEGVARFARGISVALRFPDMNTEHAIWRRLTPDTISELPESGAVFEVANLVRTVHFIGTAQGNLRQRVANWSQDQAKLSPTPGGYFIRYQPAAVEDKALEDRLSSYRAAHGGRLPTGNREQTTTVSKTTSRTAA